MIIRRLLVLSLICGSGCAVANDTNLFFDVRNSKQFDVIFGTEFILVSDRVVADTSDKNHEIYYIPLEAPGNLKKQIFKGSVCHRKFLYNNINTTRASFRRFLLYIDKDGICIEKVDEAGQATYVKRIETGVREPVAAPHARGVVIYDNKTSSSVLLKHNLEVNDWEKEPYALDSEVAADLSDRWIHNEVFRTWCRSVNSHVLCYEDVGSGQSYENSDCYQIGGIFVMYKSPNKGVLKCSQNSACEIIQKIDLGVSHDRCYH